VVGNHDDGTEISWQSPSGHVCRVLRKKATGTGDLYTFPKTELDGVLLLESDSKRTVIDTTATKGQQWYYGVFCQNPEARAGWSIIRAQTVDSWCVGCPNTNLLRDKPVVSPTMHFQITYGEPHFGVDGNRESQIGTTDTGKLRDYNGGDASIRFVVDMKIDRKVRYVVAWQPGSTAHFSTNKCNLYWKENNGDWKGLGTKNMATSAPGGLGATWDTDVDARYLRVRCWDQTGCVIDR
jgi:hypothetical protein